MENPRRTSSNQSLSNSRGLKIVVFAVVDVVFLVVVVHLGTALFHLLLPTPLLLRLRSFVSFGKRRASSAKKKSMTAQVLSIPRDFTDNKVKEDNPYGQTGTSVSVSYHTEVARLESFRGWTISFISKTELARYGFYYVGPNDMVKCYFCRVEIGLWEPNDNVLSEHLRWSPYCPLLRKRQTNNVPIDASFLDQLPEPSYDTCGIRIRENSVAENAYSSSDRSSSGSLTSPPSSLTSESSMASNGPVVHQQLAAPVVPQQKRPEYPNFGQSS